MAKKKEVKEVVKAPLLRNENENEEVYETDVRPFCINFGKSWLECTEVSTIVEEDPETGTKSVVVTMQFNGKLDGNESSEMIADEVVMTSNIVEE